MNSGAELLKTESITKRFGGLCALSNVDVTIDQGDIVGLIGPNGSGKTTLFNCICGFYHPEEGNVFLNGENCTSLEPHQIAQRGVSRTFQLAKLFYNLPVIDNIMLARHLTRSAGFLASLAKTKRFRQEEQKDRDKALEIIDLVDLTNSENKIARDLPYGSQRLLTLAIALSSNPALILLDEPTAGMNQEEAAKLGSILKDINAQGTTVFLVEHNMKFVMGLSRRMIVLNHGEVICQGTPESVRNEECVVDAYLGKGFQCSSQ